MLVMKKFVLIIFLSLFSMTGYAAVKLLSSRWRCLEGQKYLSVVLSLDKIKYKNCRPFKEFLYKAERAKGWEDKSLVYFIREFNVHTVRKNLELVPAGSENDSKYTLVLVPENVTGGGRLIGNAVIVDNGTNETLFTFAFESWDGDDNDEIALRDALKDLGNDFGKLFYKYLKKL